MIRRIGAALTFLGLLATAQPAAAKGPAMTWEFLTERSMAGGAVVIELRMWEWAPDGSADTTRPWEATDWFEDRFPLDMEVRPVDAGRGAGRLTVPVPPFRRAAPAVYRATVRLPRAGTWRLAWSDESWNTLVPGRRLPGIRVRPPEARGAPGAANAGVAVAALSLLLLGMAWFERTRVRGERT